MRDNPVTQISVAVEATYLAHESEPTRNRYLFAYTVTLKNIGEVPARLVSRYWKITGGDGREQEVRGDGVVGQHPYLMPEQSFTYTSAAILDTPMGMMQGFYTWRSDAGESFDVEIPAFSLATPQTLH